MNVIVFPRTRISSRERAHSYETNAAETEDAAQAIGDEEEAQTDPVGRLAYRRVTYLRPRKRSRMRRLWDLVGRRLLGSSSSSSHPHEISGRSRHPGGLHHGLRCSSYGDPCEPREILRARTTSETMGLNLGALAEYLEERYPGLAWTDAEISRRTGISRDAVKRYRTEGIPIFVADEIAIDLGVHPSRIWDRWWSC